MQKVTIEIEAHSATEAKKALREKADNLEMNLKEATLTRKLSPVRRVK